jgi:NIPSNAP protein
MTLQAARIAAIAALTGGAAGAFIIGPWNGDKIAGETTSRVFELRVYHTFPGRLPALQSNFRDHNVDFLKKHGITSIGYWTPHDAPDSENTLIFILAHDSREAAARHWKEFRDDPEWQKIARASQADGEIVERVESTFLTPTDYSALK